MIWVDAVILAIVALSALVGFVRGFLREAVGLAIWVAALYLGLTFAQPASGFLRAYIDARSMRVAVAFGIIFVLVLIAGAIVNYGLGRLVGGTGFAGTDRALGLGFGIVRGVAVLIVLVLLAGATPIPRDHWWQRSLFIAQLEQGALWVRDLLPPGLAGAISYPDAPDATGAPTTSTT